MPDIPTPADTGPATEPVPAATPADAIDSAAVPVAADAPAAQAPPAPPELTPAACAARLADLFPAVFAPGVHKPLKLRIQQDIQQRVPGVFTKKLLSIFLQRHTTSTAYLKALLNTPQRTDLDGQPAGDVAEEHRQAAQAELQRRREIHDARRAAERLLQREAQRESHRAAQEAARKAQETARKAQQAERRADAAQEQARSERAALLRAFETSTLTRKNFCVLKGVPEAELDALLAQAKQERQERPQAPRADRQDRPGRPDARPPAHGPRPPERRPAAGPKPGR